MAFAKPGPPHWAGASLVLENEVVPVARRFGVSVTSSKRPYDTVAGPQESDHYTGNTDADARDLGTYNGAPLARAVAGALGINANVVGTYAEHRIVRRGATFSVQILWAVQGHFNHVHVGLELVSGRYQIGPKRWGENLVRGDRGAAVEHLQRRLRAHGWYPRPMRINGVFGRITEQRVRSFQRKHFGPANADGIVGPLTQKALDAKP